MPVFSLNLTWMIGDESKTDKVPKIEIKQDIYIKELIQKHQAIWRPHFDI